ncbi:MAG: hypothetical protein H6719_06305 [Sandaracinaceae bacterium]|nr:hypothetical protein [Sandaracinaceae bacterium]
MSTERQGGTNPVVYIVLGVVALGGAVVCCLAAIAAGFWFTSRSAPEVVEETRPARDHALEERAPQGPVLGGSVDSRAPTSLNLQPTRTSDRRWRHIEATVTRADGSIGLAVGDRCSFDVQVLDRAGPPGHYCRTFAQCTSRMGTTVRLFGEELPRRTGFFPCELYDAPLGVAGEDLEPTISFDQGDPIFQIDTRAMTFMAADNEQGRLGTAYHVVARIDTVTPR